MERNTLDDLIKKAMDIDAMELQEPDARLVMPARDLIAARKKQLRSKTSLYDRFFSFLAGRLKLYQLGFSVLVTCLCLFYSVEISVDNKNSRGFSDYSVNPLSIRNATVSVNSSTLLTSIPTLRN